MTSIGVAAIILVLLALGWRHDSSTRHRPAGFAHCRRVLLLLLSIDMVFARQSGIRPRVKRPPGSERFSELLARCDVAPCSEYLERQLVLCRAPSPGSELAPWGRVLSE